MRFDWIEHGKNEGDPILWQFLFQSWRPSFRPAPPFTDTISAEIPDLSRLWLPWDWPLSTHAWGPRPTKLSNQSPSWKTNKKWPSRDFPRSILRFVSPSFLLWISGRLLTSVQNVKCYLQPSVARHAESEDSETLQNMFSSQPQSSDVHRVDFSLRGTQLLKDHFLQSASGSPWIYHFHGKLLQKFNLISSSPIQRSGIVRFSRLADATSATDTATPWQWKRG